MDDTLLGGLIATGSGLVLGGLALFGNWLLSRQQRKHDADMRRADAAERKVALLSRCYAAAVQHGYHAAVAAGFEKYSSNFDALQTLTGELLIRGTPEVWEAYDGLVRALYAIPEARLAPVDREKVVQLAGEAYLQVVKLRDACADHLEEVGGPSRLPSIERKPLDASDQVDEV